MKISDIKIAIARKKLLALAGSPAGKDGSRKVGVILDSEEESGIKSFLGLKQDLGLREEDFLTVMCLEKPVKNVIFDTPVITRKDFGWNGKPGETASAFLNSEYDVLISFTAEENKMADFLVSVSRARLKVGRKTVDKKGIFDLNISAALSDPEIFITELKKYLKILNTTTA